MNGVSKKNNVNELNYPKIILILFLSKNLMKETINNVKIDKIERVQNLRLWNHNAFRRQTLQQELHNIPL